MNRIGWTILALVLLAGAAFVSMTRFGGPPPMTGARHGPKVVEHLEQVVRDRLARWRGGGAGSSPGQLVVPVQGIAREALIDSWGQARSEGREHHGTDIPAPGGTPILAAADGTVEKLFQSGRGGTTLYERSTDGRWVFYYAHLANYAPGVREGQRIRAGEPIAAVGDTGDAGPGNTHLHFGLTRMTPGQRWYEGEDVNPYPILAAAPAGR